MEPVSTLAIFIIYNSVSETCKVYNYFAVIVRQTETAGSNQLSYYMRITHNNVTRKSNHCHASSDAATYVIM